MRAEERAVHLAVVPRPTEWDDVLDTSDILEEQLFEQSGEVEIEVHVSDVALPDLIDAADEWDDNPTREVQLRPRVTHESGLFARISH